MFPNATQYMEWKTPLGLCSFVLSFLIGTQSDSLNSAIPNALTYAIITVVWIIGLLIILSRIKDWYVSDLRERVEENQETDKDCKNS
jgi:hypothetical protein